MHSWWTFRSTAVVVMCPLQIAIQRWGAKVMGGCVVSYGKVVLDVPVMSSLVHLFIEELLGHQPRPRAYPARQDAAPLRVCGGQDV